jgi:uncharacterized membrane protein YkvI
VSTSAKNRETLHITLFFLFLPVLFSSLSGDICSLSRDLCTLATQKWAWWLIIILNIISIVSGIGGAVAASDFSPIYGIIIPVIIVIYLFTSSEARKHHSFSVVMNCASK